jgi:hypothetical protein
MNLRRPLLAGAVGAAVLGLVPAGLAVASAHSASTTIKFIATTTASSSSKTGFQMTGTETQGGKRLGWFVVSCQITAPRAASCGGAGSAPQGMLYFKFPTTATAKTFSGKVTGGTGAFSGATGTIKGKAITSKKEAVTVVIK